MATQSYPYPTKCLTIELLPGCVVWWVCGQTVQQGIQALNFWAAELLLTVTTAEQDHVRLQWATHLWYRWETIKSVGNVEQEQRIKLVPWFHYLSVNISSHPTVSTISQSLFYNKSLPSLISVPNTIARAPDTLTQCSNDCCRRL